MKNFTDGKTKKVKYNPFKMFGSYVGLILFFVMAIEGCWSVLFGYDYNMTFFGIFTIPASIFVLIIAFLGFIIGWGIHSLFRYLVFSMGGMVKCIKSIKKIESKNKEFLDSFFVVGCMVSITLFLVYGEYKLLDTLDFSIIVLMNLSIMMIFYSFLYFLGKWLQIDNKKDKKKK